jgi:aldehyde:ferredoxin oxidoreductase
LREGIDPRSVRLPDRILGRPPLKAGPLAGVSLDNEAMIEGYYRELGWDPDTGWPTQGRLKQLGLTDVAAVLYGAAGKSGEPVAATT